MDEVTNPSEQLETIAKTLRDGGVPPGLTVREFLRWFGARRRGYWIVRSIRKTLEQAGLSTFPDFESAWIDGLMTFRLNPQPSTTEVGKAPVSSTVGTTAVDVPPSEPPLSAEFKNALERGASGPAGTTGLPMPTETSDGSTGEGPLSQDAGISASKDKAADPSHRISKLEAANHRPVCVVPDSTLSEAVTIMLTNDYSQVPVMPNERDVKGVVTWQSIGSRLALDQDASTARDVMDGPVEIRSDASIFAAIPVVGEHGYVLVRGSDDRIVGIVTSSDLSLQFQQLAEPFLLLSEIENRIRNIIASHFDRSELASVRDPEDDERKIESVDDLTFGEYIRLLEEPSRWGRASLPLDRRYFIKSLDNVRRIRNDVMHFDPDGIPSEDTGALRDFVRFLQKLETIGLT